MGIMLNKAVTESTTVAQNAPVWLLCSPNPVAGSNWWALGKKNKGREGDKMGGKVKKVGYGMV